MGITKHIHIAIIIILYNYYYGAHVHVQLYSYLVYKAKIMKINNDFELLCTI